MQITIGKVLVEANKTGVLFITASVYLQGEVLPEKSANQIAKKMALLNFPLTKLEVFFDMIGNEQPQDLRMDELCL